MAGSKSQAGRRSVAVRYSGAGGGLYSTCLRGGRLTITINKGSPLFASVKSPLYLVALAVTEARIAAAAGNVADAASYLEERNRALAPIIGGWDRAGAAPPAAKGAAAAREYRLSPCLEELHSFLDVHYPHKFAFTGLSTLARYAHNALASPFYSLYTEKRQGRQLADTILKCGSRYAPLISPVGGDLDLLFDLAHPKDMVVIREYAPSEIAGPLAPPARAWADLFREVSRYRMPLMPEDLSATLEELRDRQLLDRRALESVLRRRGRPGKAQAIIEQVFAAQ